MLSVLEWYSLQKNDDMRIVFIGSGNLATNFAKELYAKSFKIEQVYSRTIESAKLLAKQVNAEWTNNINEITSQADLYIFSVKDDVLEEVLRKIPSNDGLWIHTSGSLPLDIFRGHNEHFGVIYPLQTFSKSRQVHFENIPLFIEASDDKSLSEIGLLCEKVSSKIHNLSSEKRKYIHLTGVFASNFANHMYAIANNILREQEIPFDVLFTLIDETTAKIHDLMPEDAQTGPAVRYDENIINKHLALLDKRQYKSIYTLLSQSIHDSEKPNN